MIRSIGLQLYSLREYSQTREDFIEVVKRVAKIGYKVVEPAGLHDMKPAEFRALLDDLGLEMVSTHSPWAHNPEECTRLIDELGEMRLDKCVCGYGPKDFEDLDAIKRTADNTNAMLEIFNKAGITLFQHNHAFEFQKVEGEPMLEYMIQHTDPRYVFYQMDVYWTVMGQASPVDLFHKYPGRFKMLHIKDLREIGQSGMVGFDAIFRNAATAGVEQIVVEVEQYSYDVEKSVRLSLEYLLEAPFVKASYSK